MRPLVVATTGFMNSGKSTAVKYLHKRGCGMNVNLGNTLLAQMRSAGREQDLVEQLSSRAQLRRQQGADFLVRIHAGDIERSLNAGGGVLLDSVLHISELEYVRKRGWPFLLIYICSSFECRARRRRRDKNFNAADLVSRDELELQYFGINSVFESADIKIANEGRLPDFLRSLRRLVDRYADGR